MEDLKDPETKKSIKFIVQYLAKNPQSYSNIAKNLSSISNVTSVWDMWGSALAFGNLSLELISNEAVAPVLNLVRKYNGNRAKLIIAALQNDLLEEVQNIGKDLLLNFFKKLGEQYARIARIEDLIAKFIDLFKSLDSKQLSNISDAIIDIISQDEVTILDIRKIAINLVTEKILMENFLNALANHLTKLDISDKLEILEKEAKADDITPLDRVKFIISEQLACSKEIYHCLAQILIIIAPKIKEEFSIADLEDKSLNKILRDNQKDLAKLFAAILQKDPDNQLINKLNELIKS